MQSYTKHAQTFFFLLSFPKQASIKTVYIACTLDIISNLEMINVSRRMYAGLHVYCIILCKRFEYLQFYLPRGGGLITDRRLY